MNNQFPETIILSLLVSSVLAIGSLNSLGPLSDLGVVKSVANQAIHDILGPVGPHIGFMKMITEKARVKSSDSRYCDRDLGCFSASDPDFWHAIYRPLNLLPKTREDIATEYVLFTRRNVRDGFRLRPAPLGKALADLGPLNIQKTVRVIIHGWLDARWYIRWMDELKDQLLLNDDVNVIIVDWKGGNTPPYTKATANARVVGAELALLLSNLQASGVDTKNVHIIGHSLGAHVAGYAGERLPKVGRITGLDPAGPYFQGMPSRVRLDSSDALLVDVWHTDGGPLLKLGLGMNDAIGHVDFYPNGGKEQPGCANQRVTTIVTEGLIMGVRRFLGCNHERAIQLYLHTVNANRASCRPWAFPCPDWDTFNNGHCTKCGLKGQQCAPMDLDVMSKEGATYLRQMAMSTGNSSLKLYLRTNSEAPYCVHHYHVSVRLSSSKSAKSQTGKLTLYVVDKQGRTVQMTLGKSNADFHPGATYQFLVTSKEQWELDNQQVRLKWKSSKGILHGILFNTKLYVEAVTVKLMGPKWKNDNGSDRWEDGQFWSFSVPKGNPISSGETIVLGRV